MRTSLNKNRFRNFCIGLICTCSLSLWAFSYRTAYQPATIGTPIPIHEVYGAQIMAHTIPPPPIKKTLRRRKKTEPYRPDARIKVVSNMTSLFPARRELKPLELSKATMPFIPVSTSGSEISDWVDIKPSFPGGQEALSAFFDKHINYLAEYFEDEGNILIQFVVDEDGNVSEIKTLKNEMSITALREINRVMKLMPQWIPGKKAGKPVKSRFIQPFVFQLF